MQQQKAIAELLIEIFSHHKHNGNFPELDLQNNMIDTFKKDVDSGLSATSKYLNSKYFYDKIGDAIFVEIMNMPEYYLTKAEFDIFKNQTHAIIEALKLQKNNYFELIELGAGDGTKTKELLKVLKQSDYDFKYVPIDISDNALAHLEASIISEIDIPIEKMQGDYFEVLKSLKQIKHPKVVLFLGSNIGNLSDEKSKDFANKLGASLHKNDKVLLGVDLIKDASIVLPAYNDSQGITKRFNFNILTRINKELGGNFDLDQFDHQPEYKENDGIARSFLISKIAQDVTIEGLNTTYHLKEGERIHTETSRKYNDAILNAIFKDSGMVMIDKLTDSKNYFADYIFNKS